MKANPAWSIKFIQEQTKFDEAVAKAEFENTIMGLSDNGEMKEAWVGESLELGKLAGLADLPAPKDLFTTQFVPVQTIAP
jgi:NitT/TauT family transport system substrate-binding protein